MLEFKKILTSTPATAFTPPEGSCLEWLQNVNGTIKHFRKLSTGEVVEVQYPSTGSASGTVDAALSNSSVNPVQNKVVTDKFNELAAAVNSLNTSLSGAEQNLVALVRTAEGI